MPVLLISFTVLTLVDGSQYHLASAASVVALDLFQNIGSSSSVLNEERAEIMGALEALRTMQELSSIATRGVVLISNLLEEESRLRATRRIQSPPRANGSTSSQIPRKRRSDDPGERASKRSPSTAALLGALERPEPISKTAPLQSPPVLLSPPNNDFWPAQLPEGGTADFFGVYLGSGFDPLQGALSQDWFSTMEPMSSGASPVQPDGFVLDDGWSIFTKGDTSGGYLTNF